MEVAVRIPLTEVSSIRLRQERVARRSFGEKMRILQLTDMYPPAIGGTERAVQELATELSGRGHSLSVATTALNASGSSIDEEGPIRVYRCHGGWAQRLAFGYQAVGDRPHHIPTVDPGFVRELRRVVQVERPDVIHSHNWMVYSLLGARNSVPILHTLNDYGLVCHKKSNLFMDSTVCRGPGLLKCINCGSSQYGGPKSAVLAASLRISRSGLNWLPAKYTAVSEAVRQASLVAAAGREIEVVPGYYTRGTVDNRSRPPGLPTEDFILYVGALSAFKGLHVLLAAYRELGPRAPALVVIGTAREDTPQEWPANTTVLQDVDHETVLSCWAHCLFGIVPSVWPEPFGKVAVEAMAAGKAVVASRLGGLKDLVQDKVTGLLVEPGSVQELAGAMRTLIGHPNTAQNMGKRAALAARHYDVATVTGTFERIYTELLHR